MENPKLPIIKTVVESYRIFLTTWVFTRSLSGFRLFPCWLFYGPPMFLRVVQ